MLAKAATITINVLIDLDDMTPDVSSEIVVEPEFSFLAQTPDIIGAWINGVGNQLATRGPDRD